MLAAATGHLGALLADLYVAMPSLASCGFVASMAAKFANHSSLLSNTRGMRFALRARVKDDASAAVAAIPRKLGVDSQALAAIISDAQNAFDGISR